LTGSARGCRCAPKRRQGRSGMTFVNPIRRRGRAPRRTPGRRRFTRAAGWGIEACSRPRAGPSINGQEAIMRILLASCVFIGCALGTAAAEEAAQEHSMTGCLQRGDKDDAYMLTVPGAESGPQAVIVAAPGLDLAPHVGHKVQVTGTVVPGGGPDMHTMEVTG